MMKNTITKFFAAIALLAFMAPSMVAWGQTRTEITWTASEQGYTNAQDITNVSFDDNVSGVFAKGTGSNPPKYYTSGTAIRCYGGNTIAISTTVGNLTGITITFGSSDGSNAITTDVGSYENDTWSGEAESVTFTIGGTSGNRRIAGFSITYATEAATVAMPTFNPASGTEFGDEGLEVTINCETENVSIYYTTDGSTPDDESTLYIAPFIITETTTVKAIAYDGDDNTSNVASATFTYVDPNAPGTLNNPYTVAQARAAIDANTGITGVYATGIVSAIPTAYSTQYSNITFNFVDNEGDTDFLQAYRCVSGNGVDASEVAVGDIVVVYGNLKKYNSTYEFDAACQLVSLEHPAVAVEAPTFSPIAGTYAEAQSVTISCETTGATIYYTIDGTEPTNASTQYTAAINVESTTTIKAIAYDGEDASTVATANYYFCSADDPYTVTEALAFASYQYPANGIYVEGIVSTAAESLSSGTLTYYISVDGEATDELEVYKGKGLNNEAFAAVDDIQVGDIVTIYGNVQVYNGTIEFGSGNYLVSFERPQSTEPSITVANATVEVEAEGAEGTLTVTYDNITEIVAEVYFCDAEGEAATYDWITAVINSENNVEYLVEPNEGEARTAYFKVYALDDNAEDVYSNLVTINQAAYVAPALDYATLPFEFDGGRADIETTDGLTQEGLDSDYSSSPKLKFNTTGDWLLLHFIEQPGKLTFDIKGNSFSGGTFTVQTSEDGETFADLETYTELTGTTVYSEEFNNLGENVRYIKWIYTEKVNGNVALGNITLAEYTGPVAVITVEPATVEVPVDGAEGTLTVTYENIAEVVAEVYFCDAEGEETTYDWFTASINDENNVEYLVEANEGEARTAYLKIYALDDNTEDVYSNLVTINQAAYVDPGTESSYVRITSLAQLTDGSKVVIAARRNETNANEYAAMSGTASGKPTGVNFTSLTNEDEEEVLPSIIADEEEVYYWIVNLTSQGYTFTNADGDVIGYGTSGTNFVTGGTNIAWTIEKSTSDETAMVGEYTGFVITNKNNTGRAFAYNGSVFGAYATSNMNASGYNFYLDFFVQSEDAPITETYTLNIDGYSTATNPDGGYYLIASPVIVNPASVEGMTDGNFDLYYFDQAEDNEWQNWKDNDATTGHFNLVPGKGYLYAHETGGAFELTGTPYTGNGVIELDYTEGPTFAGWNLVGNPFGADATITTTSGSEKPFYVMNEEGTDLAVSDIEQVAAMEGVFVVADADGQTVTFTEVTEPTNTSKIVMNILSNRSNVIDRAIVRFGQGEQLPKFMLNPNNTKIYIPQYESNYAMVRSENEAEMPVSFKAATNGTYTISVNAENVDMDYMHLIDNLTGNDIDLRETPSYTFEANTTDNANRFTLVYGILTGVNENNENNFAYFNGSNWTISSNGNATLQVVDLTGRVLSSEQLNGTVNVNINQAAGVYMLRLVNGDNVMTQKVVVK